MKERHGTNQRPWSCDACKLKFRTKAKIMGHICKHELKNPSFGTFYTKSWYNANGCNALYCSLQNRDVAWLHSEKCWREDVACFWPGSIAKSSVKHFQMVKVIKNREIFWKDVIRDGDVI